MKHREEILFFVCFLFYIIFRSGTGMAGHNWERSLRYTTRCSAWDGKKRGMPI